ncbi:MAG: hypothetical protein LBN97_03885 [Oscillospiraceae bacterium]|jgi:formate C-acetyltransferase|nr:hypothetical protein [Oscillospiraceae bacterium]
MYKFSLVSPRISRYRQRVRDRVIIGDAEKSVFTAEAIKLYGKIVPIIKRPLITKYLCERMTTPIFEDDYFAGSKGKYFAGCSGVMWGALPLAEMPEDWYFDYTDNMWHNKSPEQRLAITPEDLAAIQDSGGALWESTDSQVGDAWLPDGAEDFFALEASDYGDPGRPGVLSLHVGHLTPGWGKILSRGYGSIRKEAQDFLDSHSGNIQGEAMKKYMFYKSITIVCDAAAALISRYGEEAARQAALADHPERKAELLQMADSLKSLSTEPARNYREALQAVLLYQLLLAYEQTMPGPALGRFDQYAWPYLKRDLDSGALTREQAQELTDAFFLKANCYYEGGYGKMAETAGIGNTYQHTTIGGIDPDSGEDSCNTLSFMVLETIGRLKLHDPTVSMRVHPGTTDELWNCALETSKLVGGLPLFQNDEVIIPGLQKELGFTLRDARDYSIIGCQEIVGSGCDFPAPNGVGAAHASLYYGVVLDMALNNGVNPMNGKKAPLDTGFLYDMTSIDEVKAAYAKMSGYLLKWYVTINNYAEYLAGYNLPYAMLSMSMRGCMEKGLDCSSGGCDYNSYGGTATGLATIADSIATINYMCFDKKLCTTRELYDAYMSNWEGKANELLRQRILSDVPHYGNADPYADNELKWAADTYYQQCSECSSIRSKTYKAGMYGAADHVQQGEWTWATPDGRKTGTPIADAISPAQSRDGNGPTGVFNSAVVFDHTKFMDGMALNLRMHPSVLSEESGIAKLREMTKQYFADGGLECQYNVVDTDTLRAAQERPDLYRDLVVRIAGYSAYFVELGRRLQDDIIARNENVI